MKQYRDGQVLKVNFDWKFRSILEIKKSTRNLRKEGIGSEDQYVRHMWMYVMSFKNVEAVNLIEMFADRIERLQYYLCWSFGLYYEGFR
jgi:hypothetical protein